MRYVNLVRILLRINYRTGFLHQTKDKFNYKNKGCENCVFQKA